MPMIITHRISSLHKENDQFSGAAISIGRTFKNVRRELGLSGEAFAAQLGVKTVWLLALERERLDITDEAETLVSLLLPALAEVAGLDIEWLEELPLVCGGS